MALAHDVLVRSLRGAPTLELGCGLGLPSIAAALAGGRVLATDWSPDAVRATAANAERNGVDVETLECSWAEPDALVERAPWPLVLASDVLYEAATSSCCSTCCRGSWTRPARAARRPRPGAGRAVPGRRAGARLDGGSVASPRAPRVLSTASGERRAS